MSTNFPTNLDNSSTIPVEGASTSLATNNVTAHQNIQDAIEAIEAKIGVDSSAVTSSHDYKLSGVTGSDKAVSKTGTETLTNKTLTSPKITVGSDAVGDLHYTSNVDGTQSRLAKGNDNQILKMNGTSLNWEDEAVTVNASTTVAGISETATSAEITAGTATGGSGAPLVVTPDALAASTPVFNGSGLTGISKLVSASDNLKHSADTERGATGTSETLVKSIVVNHPGQVRIKIDMKCGAGSGAYKIILGESSVGAILVTDVSASTSYVTYSSDLYIPAGTPLQVYITNNTGGATTYVRNFRVYYDIGTFTDGSVITD